MCNETVLKKKHEKILGKTKWQIFFFNHVFLPFQMISFFKCIRYEFSFLFTTIICNTQALSLISTNTRKLFDYSPHTDYKIGLNIELFSWRNVFFSLNWVYYTHTDMLLLFCSWLEIKPARVSMITYTRTRTSDQFLWMFSEGRHFCFLTNTLQYH